MASILEEIKKEINRYYLIPSIILIVLCVLELLYIGIKASSGTPWSIGLCILIFLGIVLTTLAIIAMVATYRELSRLHNEEKKEFLIKVEELLNTLNKLGIKSPNDASETRNKIDQIQKQLTNLGITDDTADPKIKTYIEKITNIEKRLTTLEQQQQQRQPHHTKRSGGV